MATTTFNTRISLKYDTYANWVAKDPVLLAGEAAVVVVPASSGAVAKEPSILFKVGDGSSKFTKLQFAAGLAADVYDWAKAESKPTYSANEITGLSDYISGEIQDTDTQYKLEVDADNDRKFHLYSQAKGGSTWSMVSTITIPDETVYTLVEGSTNGTVKFNGTDVKVHGLGTAAYKAEAAFDAAGAASAVKGAESDDDTKVTVYGARKLAQKGVDNASAANTAAGNAKAAADAAQGDVDALKAKVGTVPANKTVVQMIADAQTAATYNDAAVKADIKANADAIDILNGTGAGSVDKKVADAINKFATDVSDDGVVNSYKELIEWVATHGSEAAEMADAISALQGIVDGIGGEGEKATVVAYVSDAIAALKIGDYAKASELTALAGRVTTVEGKAHEHSNKAELDKIATGDKAKWDGAVTKAHEHSNKTILDGISETKVNAWDGAVTKQHEHANKTVLDGISADDVSNWNSKAAGDHKHDITELQQAAGYIIFDCGSATKNI